MKDQTSSDNWRLQEGEQPDERWTLQESEQRLADQWSLQSTPEAMDQEWQPVEYVKPRRPAMAWVLPTIVTIALLAVIGYTAYSIFPDRFMPAEERQAEVPAVVTPEAEAGVEESPPAETPAEAPTAQPAAEEPTPTEAPPTPTEVSLVAQQFGTVTSTYGVNARNAPNTDAAPIRVLQQGETLFVFEVQGEWVELFVSDTPLVEGQPLSGTIGYAAAEFVEIDTREVSQALVNQVLEFVGRGPTPTPEPLPTEAPAEAPEQELPLPTVTPTSEGGEAAPGITETDTVTDSEAASITITVGAVNGVNVRREPAAVDGNVIRLLEFGTVLPAVARNEDGTWIQVLLPDGVTGWISAEFVQVSGDAAALPLPGGESVPAVPAVESSEVVTTGVAVEAPFTNVIPGDNVPAIIVTVDEGVNARSTPDIEAQSVMLLPRGAVVPAEGRSPDSQWVQVELPTGELAWVFRDTVDATPAVGALPAVEVETPTPTPAPTAAPVVETPEPEAAEPVATATVRQLAITIYAAPDSTSEAVGRPRRGVVLDVTGRNTAGDWLQVVGDDGSLGWVAVTGVDASVEVSTLPVVD